VTAALTVTILGCGGSDGVPLIGGDDGAGAWGRCDPMEPKNRRTRASIHVHDGETGLLIDISPDVRQQLLATGISSVDGIAITHEHADHTHGIHEARRLAALNGAPVPVYADQETEAALRRRFGFVFSGDGLYRPVADLRRIESESPFHVETLRIQSFEQDHGFGSRSLGFRIGGMAYSTDVTALSDAAFDMLSDLDLWIVDCVQINPHPTHANLETALAWIERAQPKQAILTHMGPQLDYQWLSDRLPTGVAPAYDGMIISV